MTTSQMILKAIQGMDVNDEGPPSEGSDVSHWQGLIDWTVYPYDLAITKGTEGTHFKDDQAPNNLTNLISRPHLINGVYHYWREQKDPTLQAHYYLKYITDIGVDIDDVDIMALDIEPRGNPDLASGNFPSKSADSVLTWFDVIQTETGKLPWNYSNISTLENGLGSHIDLMPFPLWISWPAYWTDHPRLPAGWVDYVLWQKSWTNRVPGIGDGQVPVDHNIAAATTIQLKAFLRGEAPPTIPPTIPPPGDWPIDQITEAVVGSINEDYDIKIIKN